MHTCVWCVLCVRRQLWANILCCSCWTRIDRFLPISLQFISTKHCSLKRCNLCCFPFFSFFFLVYSAFATSLWDLQKHFQENKSAHNALGKIIHCLQEMNKFHTILLDQASRTVLKNLTSFIKNDIKEVKEYKNLFAKVSESFDKALAQNAQANKNRSQEVTEAVNILSATTSCFRHTSLDYVNKLTMLQSKKVPEILSTVSASELSLAPLLWLEIRVLCASADQE